MSKSKKRRGRRLRTGPAESRPSASVPAMSPPVGDGDLAADAPVVLKVRRLVETGRARNAVDLAKSAFKKDPGRELELLVGLAYGARADELIAQGMAVEANGLLRMAAERYPGGRSELARSELACALLCGEHETVFAELAGTGLSEERREIIEKLVVRHVADPDLLANSKALPEGHPLKLQAAAVVRAFRAVTSRPALDGEVELPEISRRSPLAAWKSLIRAIDAFYRGRVDECLRWLDSIPPDTPSSRVIPVLTALISDREEGLASATPAQTTLLGGIASDRPLLKTFRELDRVLSAGKRAKVKPVAAKALAGCRTVWPEVVGRLGQLIVIRCTAAGIPLRNIFPPGFELPEADEWYWSRLARAHEVAGHLPEAMIAWEAWLAVSTHAGRFRPGDPEVIAVWKRVAARVRGLEPEAWEQFEDAWRRYGSTHPGRKVLGRAADMGDELDALLKGGADLGFHFRRICRVEPTGENYREWMEWCRTELDEGQGTSQELAIAKEWASNVPGDAEPLLALAADAIERKAFATALKYLAQAEQAAPGDTSIESHILHCLFRKLTGHIKAGRNDLAQGDLAELDPRLSCLGEDGTLLRAVLQWAIMVGAGNSPGAGVVEQRINRLAGSSEASALLISGVVQWAGLSQPACFGVAMGSRADGTVLASAFLRAQRAYAHLRLIGKLPVEWVQPIEK